MRLSPRVLSGLLLAVILSETVQAEAGNGNGHGLRVPLVRRKRSESPNRMQYHQRSLDEDGSPVVDWSVLRRMTANIESRYGERSEMERRWVLANLNLEDDPDFEAEEDGIAAVKDASSHRQAAPEASSPAKGSGSLKAVEGGEKPATDTVVLKDIFESGIDQQYIGEVEIGTPPVKFMLSPDSGSSDTWTAAKDCQDVNCGTKRIRYDAGASSTHQDLKHNFTLTYGIGNVEGELVRDVVRLGGFEVNTTLGQAHQLSSDWKDDPADGILGLGFRQIAARKTVPVFSNLVKQHPQIESPVISFAFGRTAFGTADKSEMVIGATNAERVDGDITYYPVTEKGYWEFEMKSFHSASRAGADGIAGIVDTATTLVAMPKEQAAAFWKGVPDSRELNDGQYYTYPCATKLEATLETPDGKLWKVDEEDINLGKEKKGSDRCVGGVVASETGGKAVLGLAFLKNVYLVLDHGDEPRIGLANVKF